ncbi:MAG TPA: SusC/RagA family TonB-linked outer membrane protein, partial [Segetibacter sp.]
MRKIVSFLLCMLLTIVQLTAQTRAVSGKVTDESGTPLAGATVSLAGGGAKTTTNATGTFTINVPAGVNSLEISYVGLATQRIALGSQNTVTVEMAAANSTLEEVVVTGYGREKRTTFAGAASVISAKAIETVPVGSFDQALQGRAPGLLVNSGSGQPGTSPTITIRGVQSIQGASAQPLFILDGVPIPAGDMATLNPNDFESLTVLKDANAAALYGARGGTGVIVITTKKGKAGGTNFTYRAQVGITQAPSFERLNMMNTKEILEYEERLGLAGAGTNTPGWVYSPKNPAYAALPAATKARYDFLLDSVGNIDINYADVFYRQGFTQSHDLNMSGGNDKSRFFLSGGYFDQEGIDRGSSLTRYTTRFNLEHTSNKVTVNFNTTAGFSLTKLSEGEFLGNSPRNPFQMTYRAKPYENPYNADGSIIFGASTPIAKKEVGNLLEGIQNSLWHQRQVKINSGLSIGYKFTPEVSLRNTVGIDVASDIHTRNIKAASYIGSLQSFQSGYNAESYRITTQLINTTSAVFSKNFNQVHDVETGAYFEVVRGLQKGLGFQQYNLDPRLTETGQGAGPLPTNGAATYPQNVSSAKSGFGIRSYFATLRYTYDGKYTVNGNIRRDGTSRIVNEANKQVTTWSAGLIWNALREDFLKNQSFFTDLRVRVSYGIIPNISSISTANYGIAGGLVSVTNYLGPQVPSYVNSAYAGSTISGQVPNSPGNPNLKIERIKKANLGLDVAFWRNRARVEMEYYNNRTVDLFVSQPLSGTTGFGSLA